MADRPYNYAIDGGTGTTAFVAKVPTKTKPASTSGTTGPSHVLENPQDPHQVVSLIFGGTDAPGETFAVRVTRWYRAIGAADTVYMPETALLAYPTLGLGVYSSTDLGAAGNLFADEVALSAAQGASRRSLGHQQPVIIDIEADGAVLLEVEIDLQTAASADVLYRWGSGQRKATTRQLDGSFA